MTTTALPPYPYTQTPFLRCPHGHDAHETRDGQTVGHYRLHRPGRMEICQWSNLPEVVSNLGGYYR